MGRTIPVTQRETQTAKYWQQFSLTDADVQVLLRLLKDGGVPLSTQELAIALIEARCQAEEVAMRAEIKDGVIYQPRGSFKVGDELVFPKLQYASGKVVGQRKGFNPHYGEFSVVSVDFGPADGKREFCADLDMPHPLNLGDGQALADAEGMVPPAELCTLHGPLFLAKLEAGLRENDSFLHFGDQWLVKDTAIPIHAGHLNIAEAAIDIQDSSLPTTALLKDFDDLPAGSSPALQVLSLNATLSADPRFVNVGPKGEARWYLQRLAPADVGRLPEALRLPNFYFDVKFLDNEMRQLMREIDDEAIPADMQAAPDINGKPVVHVLSQPHRRAGTLPVMNKNAHLFPEPDEDFVRVTFIDKDSGSRFAGWVSGQYKIVSGMGEWYRSRQLPVGAFVNLEPGPQPLTVLLSFQTVRPTRKWIRGAVAQRDQIGFQNVRQIIPCEFDDFMIVGIENDRAVDELWLKHDDKRPLLPLVRQVVLDLVKISPQGNVHAKTIYSALNVIRRCPPAPIFYELAANSSFVPMGNGYWAYDASRDR